MLVLPKWRNGDFQVEPTSLATQKWLLGAPATTPAKRPTGNTDSSLLSLQGAAPVPRNQLYPQPHPLRVAPLPAEPLERAHFRVCFGTEKRCSQTPFGFARSRPTWARRSRFRLARVWCARTRKPALSNAAAPARYVFLEWALLQWVICWYSMCPPARNAVTHRSASPSGVSVSRSCSLIECRDTGTTVCRFARPAAGSLN